MRGDAISLSGKLNKIIKTPNIDKLAKDGVAFTNCFTVNPVCAPSRCCIFTGQYVHSNAHRSLYQLLEPYEENLFKFLKLKGYNVVWFGRNDLFTKSASKLSFSKQFNMMNPFLKKFLPDILSYKFFKSILKSNLLKDLLFLRRNRIYDVNPYFFLEYPFIKELLGKHFKLNPYPLDHPLRKSFYFGRRDEVQALDLDHFITKNVLKFLDYRPKSPFCLYIAMNFPHPPYTVEEPFFSMYRREKIPDPIRTQFDDKPKYMRLMYERYGLNKLNIEDLKEIKATYFGMISRLDYHFGLIINKLKEIGEYDNTAILFLSDHGDYAGDYGLTEKWPVGFQDCLVNIPLIIKPPNMTNKNLIIDELVQSIDIFPTILEFARIKTPYTHFGKSLYPLIKQETISHRSAVFAEGGYNQREPQCFEFQVYDHKIPIIGIYYDKIDISYEFPETVSRSVMIRTKDWKLILRNGQKNELYDLKRDPYELNNLIDDDYYKNTISELKDMLLKWYINTSDNPHWKKKRNI